MYALIEDADPFALGDPLSLGLDLYPRRLLDESLPQVDGPYRMIDVVFDVEQARQSVKDHGTMVSPLRPRLPAPRIPGNGLIACPWDFGIVISSHTDATRLMVTTRAASV